jgi:hypothetical protein
MCLKEQQQTSRPLGEILLERSLVTRDQLQSLMKHQVMETVNEIVNLTEGSFSFQAHDQLPPDHIAFERNICCWTSPSCKTPRATNGKLSMRGHFSRRT